MPLDDLRNWQSRGLEKTKAEYRETMRRAEEGRREGRQNRRPDAYYTSDPIGNWLTNRAVDALKFIGALLLLAVILAVLALASHH